MTKKTFKDYISKPTSERILKNIAENRDKFIDVMRELSDPSSELAKKNPPSALLTKNFKAHPHIHIGYYDERRNNVLMVCDALDNDKLIEKRISVLLCDGTFTKLDDSKVIFDASYVSAHVEAALSGSTSERKWCEGKYLYESSIELAIPVEISDYVQYMSVSHLSELLYHVFVSYQNYHGQPNRPFGRDEFNSDEFIAYFNSNVINGSNSLSRIFLDRRHTAHRCKFSECLEIPPSSPLLPGMILTGDMHTNITHVMERVELGERPALYVNDDRPTWGFNVENPTLAIYPIGSFPCTLGIRLSATVQGSRTENRASDNNNGRLLAHNAKVDAYKVGFIMSAEEKAFFDRKDKEYKESLKEFEVQRQRAKKRWEMGELSSEEIKAMKPPIKPPQDNPVYLGVEIELVTKGLHRTQTGKATLVKEIADSVFGDHCIVKSDGSLRDADGSDNGIEITTVPATLSHHLKMFKVFFDHSGKVGGPRYNAKALNIIDKLMSNERCGIHVHIAKNCLSTSGWSKFQEFIYSPINTGFMDKMAGRKPNQYCVRLEPKVAHPRAEFTKRITNDGTVKGQLKFQDENRNDFVRRVMVNTQNAHTMEVRMFKSSTDKNNVLRKLEFCDAAVHMIQSKDIGLRTFDYFDFINFILEKDNRKKYIHITRWLSAQGMIGHERKRIKSKESKLYNKIVTAYKYNLAKLPTNMVKHKDTKTGHFVTVDYYKTDQFLADWLWSPHNKTTATAKRKEQK